MTIHVVSDEQRRVNRAVIAELSTLAGYARDHTPFQIEQTVRSRISALIAENTR